MGFHSPKELQHAILLTQKVRFSTVSLPALQRSPSPLATRSLLAA